MTNKKWSVIIPICLTIALGGLLFINSCQAAPTITNQETINARTIKISWPAQTNAIYKIYVKKSGDNDYSLKEKITATRANNSYSFEIGGLNSGTSYLIKLEECDLDEANCTESVSSSEIAVNPQTPSFSVLATSNSALVTIDSVIGANSYQVCRQENMSNFIGSIGVATGHTFTVLPETNYSFKIRACNASASLTASNCATDVPGCSSFSAVKKVKTGKVTSLADTKTAYTKLNESYLKKITQYEQSAGKLKLIASSTVTDYLSELSSLKGELGTKLLAVNALSDSDQVQARITDLKSFAEPSLDVLKIKLQTYSVINKYYLNFDKFIAKVNNDNKFKNDFQAAIAKAEGELVKEENAVAALILSNRTGVTDKYRAISSYNWYKYISLIYEQLSYYDNLYAKIYSLKDLVLQDLQKKFAYIPQGFKTTYAGLADQELLACGSAKYFVPSEWLDLNNYSNFKVYNRYKDLKTYSGHTKIAFISSGLNSISLMQNVASSTRAKFYEGFDADLLASSTAIYNQVTSDLTSNAASSLSSRILNPALDPATVQKNEIKTYAKHKVYGYYAQGATALNQIIRNKTNPETGLDALLDLASDVINASTTPEVCRGISTSTLDSSILIAKNKLLSLDLTNYNSSKEKYNKEIKAAIQKARDDFSTVSDKLDACLKAVEDAKEAN